MTLRATLRRTLSLHFLLVAILPALIFGLVAISLLHKYLEGGIYERNRQLSGEIAATTEHFLAEVEFDLGTAARILEKGTIVRPEAVDVFLEAVAQESEWIDSIYLLDKRRTISNLGFDPQTGLRRDDYRAVDLSNHTLFRQYAVIDRPLWSDSFVSLDSGEPSVTLVVPVSDGMLFGNINLRNLSRHLARFAMGPRDNCAIVDHSGTLIASSKPELTTQRVNFGDHLVIGRAVQGKSETVLENHGNLQLLESTVGITRTGWVAWVGVDMGAKMEPVVQTRNLLGWILALALVAAAGIALLDARRLMMPLSALSERAGQIAAGHYVVDVPSSGFIEIDNLTTGMQEMSAAIRKREQSLISSEQRFRDLVNSIDGVVWEMEVASGNYLFVSEQSAAMFGYPPARWLDDPDFWASRVHPDDAARVVIRGRHSLALAEKHDLEYRFVVASGQPIWVRDLITIIWEEQEPARLLGVMIDITERKQAEAELERYRASLEELVMQRTLELQAAQSELVQKERLAVLGQLTATVSHEIRNPLGTVANSLFLVRETLGDDCLGRVERPLMLAERGVERCDGIISELLDFTRRRELQCEPLALDAWLAEMLDEMVWPESVCCRRQLDSGVIVQADPERLRRALVNVISNALQAMESKPPGGHCLAIATRRQNARCEIVVSDTGEGIPEAILDRIFEPLFSTKNFGVGLGVPIIRNIMSDHGGGVEYRSRVGEGTTVILWLPVAVKAPA